MSGRYQDLVGVPGVIRTHAENSWGYLRHDAVLLPALLKSAGYHTAIVGKWHLGLAAPNVPNDRGFDFFHGWLGDMMDDYYTHRRHNINYMRRDRQQIDPQGHATDLFTDWSVEYINRHAATHRDEPFFLYLAYNAPHTPIQPPSEWVERVRQRQPGNDLKRAKLVALIEHMDEGIGRVLKTLKETGLADNTLVVFTSDNGGQLNVGANNGPLRDGKQSMYEGGLKVPMAAVWPGRIEPGRALRADCALDGPVSHAAGGRRGEVRPPDRRPQASCPRCWVASSRRSSGRCSSAAAKGAPATAARRSKPSAAAIGSCCRTALGSRWNCTT